MPIPYIGITDFTNFSQVEEMLDVYSLYRGDHQNHRLHVGVMMSRKTLLGKSTKWSDAFPPKEAIAGIFASPKTMNCLHYADYDEIDVVDNLAAAIRWGGDGINALQLDMVWPSPDHIAEAILRSGKQLEVILQVGRAALEMMGNDPDEVVAQVRCYTRFVQHVLLDKSGGRGIGMDAESLRPFVRAIRKELPELGITVAGGLGPYTIDLVKPLTREFSNLSIDAQGKLRPSGDALDPINWGMAGEYLAKALHVMNGARAPV